MSDPNYNRFDGPGWVGVVREDWRTLTRGDLFQTLMGYPHQTVRDRPASRVYRIDTPRGAVYLKHMTAQRDDPSPTHRLIWRLRPSRALAVCRSHRALAAAGLAAPGVVLAARRRSGQAVEDLLVTDAAGGASLEDTLRTMTRPGDRAALLHRVGQQIGRLHNRRLIHGDLLPGNLLIQLEPDQPTILFIDNDRTRRWPIRPFRRHRRRNLEQMLYRLLMRLPWRTVRALLDGYAKVTTMPPAVRRRFEARAIRRALARIKDSGRTRAQCRRQARRYYAELDAAALPAAEAIA